MFLSSRDDEVDRILGLELGGDDYLAKPFSPRELVARVRAVLPTERRPAAAATAGPAAAAAKLLRVGRCAWTSTAGARTGTGARWC